MDTSAIRLDNVLTFSCLLFFESNESQNSPKPYTITTTELPILYAILPQKALFSIFLR